MAQKKQTKSEEKDARYGGGYGDYTFLNCNLDKDSLKEFFAWEIDDSELWVEMDGLVQTGYSFRVSFSDYHHAVTASITCSNPVAQNTNLILTAHGPSAYDAFKLVMFKHLVYLAGDWEGFIARKEERNVWG